MKIQPIGKQRKTLSPSEALYGFGGWLTGRDEPITMSATHNAGIVAELIDIFCKTNNLPDPRDHWERNLTHPKENILRKSTIVLNGHRKT